VIISDFKNILAAVVHEAGNRPVALYPTTTAHRHASHFVLERRPRGTSSTAWFEGR